jgi:hypothetical protein
MLLARADEVIEYPRIRAHRLLHVLTTGLGTLLPKGFAVFMSAAGESRHRMRASRVAV